MVRTPFRRRGHAVCGWKWGAMGHGAPAPHLTGQNCGADFSLPLASARHKAVPQTLPPRPEFAESVSEAAGPPESKEGSTATADGCNDPTPLAQTIAPSEPRKRTTNPAIPPSRGSPSTVFVNGK